MDQSEQDSVALQHNGKLQEEEEKTSNQSVLPTASLDQMRQASQGQDGDQSDEWDTDLETDDVTNAELYLQACRQLGVVPISSFLRSLSDTNLKTLNLKHYGVGPHGTKALAITLRNDSVITHLDLEDNKLKAQGTSYLMEMLQSNSSIKSLNLSNNQLHTDGAIIISKILSGNLHISSIKLSGNSFDDTSAKFIANALEGDCVIKELDLSHNLFSEEGGEQLGLMLARNEGIEILDLSWNYLRLRGFVAFTAGLMVNSSLKQLQLAWNGFGHMEAEALGQALKKNGTLQLLDISGNNIDDKVVTLLCQGLATNNTLRVLKLSLNPLTNTGALTLLKTVQNNEISALEEIDISTVFVREDFIELLEEVHQKRPALNVQYNAMSSVTRNLSALKVFQKFLDEQNESIMDFFQALDSDGTMKVTTSAFRAAVKAAKVPLDQHQLEWLMRTFDKKCTATITYRDFAESL